MTAVKKIYFKVLFQSLLLPKNQLSYIDILPIFSSFLQNFHAKIRAFIEGRNHLKTRRNWAVFAFDLSLVHTFDLKRRMKSLLEKEK